MSVALLIVVVRWTVNVSGRLDHSTEVAGWPLDVLRGIVVLVGIAWTQGVGNAALLSTSIVGLYRSTIGRTSPWFVLMTLIGRIGVFEELANGLL